MQDILEGYAAAATPSFVAAYDALSPELIYEHVIDLFAEREAKVADIGAGTGRDAAWFADKGHEVLAVEPVRELREAGRELHRSERISWLDDRLPHLTEVRPDSSFDLVTLCAVWQHISNNDRPLALHRLATIMAPGGLLVMSLRHGPGGEGRRVFPVSPEATLEIAQALGLRLIRRREAASVQDGNRAMGVSWTWLAFEKVR
jgi:SAM-dependent methyltransferase